MSTIKKVGSESYPVLWGFNPADIRKWMGIAKNYQESPDNCLSRQIGCVIVDPEANALVSAGHNGPPDDTKRCDTEDYLRNVLWPQLRQEEKEYAGKNGKHKLAEGCKFGDLKHIDEELELFITNYARCGECPRRMVGCPSGQRLELCTCAHGETNSIIRAHRSVRNMWMFCWCGVPCVECTKLIINSKIHTVVALDKFPDDTLGTQDYSPYVSRWLYKQGKTNLILVTEGWLNA